MSTQQQQQPKRTFDTNQVVLGGRVGFVEGKNVGQTYLLRFSLATTTAHKADGTPITYWHNCNLWGKYGQMMVDVIKKGTRLCVLGELTSRSYESNGEKRTAVEVNVQSVYPAAPRQEQQQPSSGPQESKGDPAEPEGGSDDEIPF